MLPFVFSALELSLSLPSSFGGGFDLSGTIPTFLTELEAGVLIWTVDVHTLISITLYGSPVESEYCRHGAKYNRNP